MKAEENGQPHHVHLGQNQTRQQKKKKEPNATVRRRFMASRSSTKEEIHFRFTAKLFWPRRSLSLCPHTFPWRTKGHTPPLALESQPPPSPADEDENDQEDNHPRPRFHSPKTTIAMWGSILRQWSQKEVVMKSIAHHKSCLNIINASSTQKGYHWDCIPVGLDKLYSGSTDRTLHTKDYHPGCYVNLKILGVEITFLIDEGPWVFAGVKNAINEGFYYSSISCLECPDLF